MRTPRRIVGYRVHFLDGSCQIFASFTDADTAARERGAWFTITLWKYIVGAEVQP